MKIFNLYFFVFYFNDILIYETRSTFDNHEIFVNEYLILECYICIFKYL